MPDLFSTDSLLGIISELKRPSMFFTSRYFSATTQDDAEEIHFDVLNKRRRLAPYVSPLAPGRLVASNGFTTDTFKPAYTKDKRVFDPSKPFKRAIGERIGGGVKTPAQRRAEALRLDLLDQIEMINRTKEAQAAQALRTGGITVEGVDYPLANISFGRNAANDIAVATTWDNAATAKPLNDLKSSHSLILKNGGGSARDVVMSTDAWTAFEETDQIKGRLDREHVRDSKVNADVADIEGVAYQGRLNGLDFFTYEEWHEDSAGVDQPVLPSNEVLLLSRSVEGIQAHGAIRDEDAGFRAMEYFSKSWKEPDPSVRYLLMQSSFLMVPTRVNAVARLTVL